MDNKPKTPLVWGVVFLAVLFFIVYLVNVRARHRVSAPATSTPEALNTEQASSGLGFIGGIGGSNNNAASVAVVPSPSASPVIALPASVSASQQAAITPASSPASAGISGNQAAQSEVLPAAEIPMNIPMTDEQISAAIEQQNQQRQALQKILADREKKAAEVRQGAEIAQGQSANNQQTAQENLPAPVVPAVVKEKLKSHELVAH